MTLDDQKQFKRYDTDRVAESIQRLPDQLRQVLDQARLIKIPRSYSKISNIVVSGTGASNLGARIVKSLFQSELKVPLEILPGYQVPGYVDKNSLYILSSYSGTTEEPLSTYREIKKREARIAAITCSGRGRLEKIMLKDNLPGYIFKPDFNPSAQPRLGLGYMIFGLAIILAKAGLFKIKVSEVENLIASLEIWDRRLRPQVKISNNQAKKIALEFFGRQPVLAGGEFLAGNLHAWRNQLNENSKNFAAYLVLPELNHYAMEGLSYPASLRNNLLFVFVSSPYYQRRVIKRLALTREVVKRQRIAVCALSLKGKSKFEQSYELLQLGSWVSYYLAILNRVNPSKIPYVDWFKQKLG